MLNAIYMRQQGGVPQGLSQVSQQLLCLDTVYCIVQCTLYTKVYTTLYTVVLVDIQVCVVSGTD